MSDDQKALGAEASLAGFRVSPSGDLEVLSNDEVKAAIWRAIREASETLSVKRRLQ
jgi:hypothetical protein